VHDIIASMTYIGNIKCAYMRKSTIRCIPDAIVTIRYHPQTTKGPCIARAFFKEKLASADPARSLFVDDQQILGVNLVTGASKHFGDGTVALCTKRGFHLHRFDGKQHVAGIDLLSD
jgi:hypothetical protein